jgi:hypothetical protein
MPNIHDLFITLRFGYWFIAEKRSFRFGNNDITKDDV